MKILVTGGAGFIGCNFIRHVRGARRHYEIVNYDKLTYAGNLANLESVAENQNYRFVRGDICDAASVETAMAGCEAVVHFAAESHVDRSIYEPAPVIETNVTGGLYIFPRTRYTAIFYPTSSPFFIAAEQSILCFEGQCGSTGQVLRAHVRISRTDYKVFE